METQVISDSGIPLAPTGGIVSGFWRRFGAFTIDYIILNTVVSSITTLLRSQIHSGISFQSWFLIVLSFLYFTISYSKLFNGQTLGMRILKVRVASISGQTLSYCRSAARAALLCIPLGSSLLGLYPEFYLSGTGAFLGVLFTLLSTSIIYLAVFNRQNGRSLHDLFAGSVVVLTQPTGLVTDKGVSRIHYVILPIICLLIIMLTNMLQSPMNSVALLWKSIPNIKGASLYSINVMENHSSDGISRVARITLELDKNAEPEKVARTAAQTVAKQMPKGSLDRIVVQMVDSNLDFYIACSAHIIGGAASPEEWMSNKPIYLQGSTEYRVLLFTAGYLDDTTTQNESNTLDNKPKHFSNTPNKSITGIYAENKDHRLSFTFDKDGTGSIYNPIDKSYNSFTYSLSGNNITLEISNKTMVNKMRLLVKLSSDQNTISTSDNSLVLTKTTK